MDTQICHANAGYTQLLSPILGPKIPCYYQEKGDYGVFECVI